MLILNNKYNSVENSKKNEPPKIVHRSFLDVSEYLKNKNYKEAYNLYLQQSKAVVMCNDISVPEQLNDGGIQELLKIMFDSNTVDFRFLQRIYGDEDVTRLNKDWRFASTYSIASITNLDVLDVSNVSTFEGLFSYIQNTVPIIGMKDWDIDDNAIIKKMFFYCHAQCVDFPIKPHKELIQAFAHSAMMKNACEYALKSNKIIPPKDTVLKLQKYINGDRRENWSAMKDEKKFAYLVVLFSMLNIVDWTGVKDDLVYLSRPYISQFAEILKDYQSNFFKY